MKSKLAALFTVMGFIGTAHAGTYTCDVELKDGSKTKLRGIVADSESHAARLARESNSNIKYINCMRVN